MAFYTSRVDNDGNEIERRKMLAPTMAMSSEDSESSGYEPSFDYDFETKSCEDNSSLSQEAGMSAKASEFEFGDNKDVNDGMSMNERMSIFGRDCDIVPPLDIRSELNFPTGNQITFQAKRQFETAKIIMEPNKHVEDWLTRKRQRQLEAVERQKRENEEKRQQAEERKRLAEEEYQKWLEKKKSVSSVVPGYNSGRQPAMQPPAATAKHAPSLAEVSAMEKKRKLEEWMHSKQKQENERRLRQQRDAKERAKKEAERKQLRIGAHEKWLERNKNAPKPVPLNQGLATLRGTVSKIFINPNEWRTD